MNRQLNLVIVAGLIVGLLASCGGGGGGGSEPIAGIDRLGVSTGTITGFGSVFVNGVEFETGNATFSIDGQPGAESDLKIGQVVTITGTIDANGTTGTADQVVFDDNVEGPISSIDLPGNSFIVLGQTVLVDGDTSFDSGIVPGSLDGLNVDDVVEVSGFVDSSQVIRATHIERRPAGGAFELKGMVASLDNTAGTFQINGFTVDFLSVPAVLDGFSSGAISDGDVVEAKGTSAGSLGPLVATTVELVNQGMPGNEDDEVELEGFVTRFVSATDFDVSGMRLTTNSQTAYEGGTSAALALNVKVEVEGKLDSNGTIVAEKIEFRQNADIRITALVDSVDAGAGTLTMLGVTIRVNALTRIEDKSEADIAQFSLANVNPGEYLVVRGSEDPSGAADVLATLLEREDTPGAPAETVVRGVVADAVEPTMTILGVTIETGAGTEFRARSGMPMTSGQFFNIAVGALVEASGVESSDTTVVAESVEFED